MADTPTRTVAAVMGANVHRLRGQRTLAELARYAQGWGLRWTSGTVANVESGRSSPTITTVYLLTLALSDLLGREVAPAELFDGTGTVPLPGGGEVELRLLRSVLSDKPVRRPKPTAMAERTRAWIEQDFAALPKRLQREPPGPYRKTAAAMLEADIRIGKSLGLDRALTARWMAYLWGKPLSMVRDERAGPDANKQQRGQIARRLKAELRKVIADGND